MERVTQHVGCPTTTPCAIPRSQIAPALLDSVVEEDRTRRPFCRQTTELPSLRKPVDGQAPGDGGTSSVSSKDPCGCNERLRTVNAVLPNDAKGSLEDRLLACFSAHPDTASITSLEITLYGLSIGRESSGSSDAKSPLLAASRARRKVWGYGRRSRGLEYCRQKSLFEYLRRNVRPCSYQSTMHKLLTLQPYRHLFRRPPTPKPSSTFSFSHHPLPPFHLSPSPSPDLSSVSSGRLSYHSFHLS